MSIGWYAPCMYCGGRMTNCAMSRDATDVRLQVGDRLSYGATQVSWSVAWESLID